MAGDREISAEVFDDPPSDFAVAQALDPQVIVSLRDGFSEYGESGEITIDQASLRSFLSREQKLSPRSVEAVFVTLSSNAGAAQVSSGSRYADYAFRVSPRRAAHALDRQYVASLAIEDISDTSRPVNSEVSLVATLPEGVSLEGGTAVGAIGARARDMVLDANKTVRIANPYFDADQRIVDDLASLPRRGVTLRVLTRETDNPDSGLLDALNTLHDGLDREGRERLDVRDLYDETEWGQHELATHAKLVVVDEVSCYVGSANLTETNLEANFEFGVVVEGCPAERTAAVFDQVFEAAEPVELPLLE